MGVRGRGEFGTDPSGIIARGAPIGDSMGPGIGGSGVNVGRVGIPQAGPGLQTTGTGFGMGYQMPITPRKAKGGKVKKMAKGGSASKRADGCATKGKTKGKMR